MAVSHEPERDLFGDPVKRPADKRARSDKVSQPKLRPEPLSSILPETQGKRLWARILTKGKLSKSATLLLSAITAIPACWFAVPAPIRDGTNKFVSEKISIELGHAYDKVVGIILTQKASVSQAEKPGESDTTSAPQRDATGRTSVDESASRAANPMQTGSISVTETQKRKAKIVTPLNPKPSEQGTRGPIATIIQFIDQLLTFGKSAGPL